MMITALIAVLIAVVLKTRARLHALWQKASAETRAERLRVFVFAWHWYADTGLHISRAYLPLVDQTFGWTNWGFICQAVVVIPVGVKQVDRDDPTEYVPVGTRSEGRRAHWTFDIGAMGMCAAEFTAEQNASKELFEELGIKAHGLELVKICMPCDGYGAIVMVYRVRLNGCIPLVSTDGTFTCIEWVENKPAAIMDYARAIRAPTLFSRNMTQLLSDWSV